MEREISTEEGKELAEELNFCGYFETSAKNGTNVDDSLEFFVREIRKNKPVQNERTHRK